MSEPAVIIECPTCKEPMAITREALLTTWDDDNIFPICTSPRKNDPYRTCARTIHFRDLPKVKLVELLRMIVKTDEEVPGKP